MLSILKKGLFILLLLFIIVVSSVEAVHRYETPDFIVEESEVVEKVFDYTTDKCEHDDIPDMPTRAFIDHQGKVHVIGQHKEGRQYIGDNLDDVVHSCHKSYVRNHSWLYSPYTFDGKTVYALIHREVYSDGWWNYIDLAKSTNGGYDFDYVGMVASIDNYIPGTFGIFEPSNIIKVSGAPYGPDSYVSIMNSHHPDHNWQMFRTRTYDLSDPKSWKATTSEGSKSIYQMPYYQTYVTGQPRHRHISYNDYLDKYISITSRWDGIVYYSLSDNLNNWTPARVLVDERGGKSIYASMLQPGDPTRNFEQTSRSPYIYVSQYFDTYKRNLLRVRIRLTKPEDEGKYPLLNLKFNEYRGDKALDSSFYGADGKLSGSYSWGNGNHLTLDGGGVKIDHQAVYNLNDTFSIKAKIKMASSPSKWTTILSKESDTNRQFGLYIQPDTGKLHFSLGNKGDYISSLGNKNVADGQWHEVVAVWDNNTKRVRYFVDGQLDAAGDYSGVDLVDFRNDAQLGIWGNAGDSLSLNEVSVYNYNLYPEVKAVCDSCPSGLPKADGNADCNNAIDLIDFASWLSVFKAGNNNAEVDFNCQASDSKNTVDLADFRVWLDNFIAMF